MSCWYIDTSAALRLLIQEGESDALARRIDDEEPALTQEAVSDFLDGVDHLLAHDARMCDSARALGTSVISPT